MAAVKLALASNTPYIPRTMVAMLSVLKHARRPVSVHVLGDELSEAAKRVIEEECGRSGAADLVFHDLEEILPRQRLLGNWPRTILARLYIPEIIDGRVLYLDGDTHTFADISPLFEMDMGGSLLGCVRDFGKLDCFEREHKREDTKYVEELMAPFPRHDYFNSGVLLFDCDGIRRDDEVRSRIARTDKLETYLSPDQDHLNAVFKNKTLFLHPSWNSFYGLDRHAVRLCKRILPPEEAHDFRPPRIIHYVDGPKPWGPFEIKWLPKTSIMVKRFPRFIEYKHNARRLLAPYKAAIGEALLASIHAPANVGKRKEGGGWHRTAFRLRFAPTWPASGKPGSPWRRRSSALRLPSPCIFSATALPAALWKGWRRPAANWRMRA